MVEDEENLEHFLEGEEFLSEEQQNEEAANERRLARKRRFQALEQDSPNLALSSKSINLPKTMHEDLSTARTETLQTKLEDPNTLQSTLTVQRETPDNGSTVSKTEEGSPSEDEDEFDMFSSSVSPVGTKGRKIKMGAGHVGGSNAQNVDQQQDWDDVEGYYRATIGEIIQLELPKTSTDVQFRISGVIGKGVFSTVLKCVTESSNLSTTLLPPEVALKVIRHNDTMAKAAIDEIRFLQRLTNASSPGVISLLLPTDNVTLDYRGHTILVFPYMEYNLRDVLVKFGKNVGLSLSAVRSYFAQLLSACWHLKQHRIIHSDLKPDNILVSGDYQSIFLADFGSAVDITESVEVAPYMVSRFYRAPEIILGLSPTYAIDLWSLAVTAAELFLGKVLFQGSDNNDMLNVMMLHLGSCSNRLIRQHLVQTKKFPIATHFTTQIPYLFRRLGKDPVSHQAVYNNTPLKEFHPTLSNKLLKAKSAKDSRTMVSKFSDLLQKCLTMDPSKRIDCKTALNHEFFRDKSQQQHQPSK